MLLITGISAKSLRSKAFTSEFYFLHCHIPLATTDADGMSALLPWIVMLTC